MSGVKAGLAVKAAFTSPAMRSNWWRFFSYFETRLSMTLFSEAVSLFLGTVAPTGSFKNFLGDCHENRTSVGILIEVTHDLYRLAQSLRGRGTTRKIWNLTQPKRTAALLGN